MRIESTSALASYTGSYASLSGYNKSHVTLILESSDNSRNSPLTCFLNEICSLSQEAVDCIDERTVEILIKKGDSLYKHRNEGDNLFFIQKGVVRGYVKSQGKDITLWINSDNEMIGSIPNLGILLPTDQHLQALEDCTLIHISQQLIEHLYEHFSEASLIGRALLEDNNRCIMERAYIRRIVSPEARFKRLIDTQPGLLARVPLKYIASYLTLTPKMLNQFLKHV